MEIINDPFEMNNDLLKGIAPKAVMHTEPILKEKFAPWHKPRKQWLRDHQWGKMISTLIDRLDLNQSGRALNYLSLPGSDMLDVRSLEDVFREKGVKLKFLGLNYIDKDDKEQDAEQLLSLNEVRELDFIEQESIVISEQFEKISVANSIASDRVLRKHQTFDVINIDLCASFADKKPGGALDTLYAAIYKLLKHQSFYRTEEWLFFITSRADKKKVELNAFKKMLETVINTIQEELAKEYLDQKIGVSIDTIQSDTFTQDNLSTLQHRNCFTASFGIWKSKTLIDGDAKTKSSMKEIFGYHVESTDAVTDMVSMAFWCSRFPLIAEDLTGLSSAQINPKAPSAESVHSEQAKRAFERSLNCIDLDAFLNESPEQYKAAYERSKGLLKKARYSMEKYETWVEGQQEKIAGMLQSRQETA